MTRRYVVESDGGSTWTGSYTSYQPITHYVLDTVTRERIQTLTDLKAKALAAMLNACDLSWDDAVELYS